MSVSDRRLLQSDFCGVKYGIVKQRFQHASDVMAAKEFIEANKMYEDVVLLQKPLIQEEFPLLQSSFVQLRDMSITGTLPSMNDSQLAMYLLDTVVSRCHKVIERASKRREANLKRVREPEEADKQSRPRSDCQNVLVGTDQVQKENGVVSMLLKASKKPLGLQSRPISTSPLRASHEMNDASESNTTVPTHTIDKVRVVESVQVEPIVPVVEPIVPVVEPVQVEPVQVQSETEPEAPLNMWDVFPINRQPLSASPISFAYSYAGRKCFFQDVEESCADDILSHMDPAATHMISKTDKIIGTLKRLMETEVSFQHQLWMVSQARQQVLSSLEYALLEFDAETKKQSADMYASTSGNIPWSEYVESLQVGMGGLAQMGRHYEDGMILLVRVDLETMDTRILARFPNMCPGTYSRMLREKQDIPSDHDVFWCLDKTEQHQRPTQQDVLFTSHRQVVCLIPERLEQTIKPPLHGPARTFPSSSVIDYIGFVLARHLRLYSPVMLAEGGCDALAVQVPLLDDVTILATWRCRQIQYWSDSRGIIALNFVK